MPAAMNRYQVYPRPTPKRAMTKARITMATQRRATSIGLSFSYNGGA
jgi:energy-converting hydrogenase Eha subunit F